MQEEERYSASNETIVKPGAIQKPASSLPLPPPNREAEPSPHLKLAAQNLSLRTSGDGISLQDLPAGSMAEGSEDGGPARRPGPASKTPSSMSGETRQSSVELSAKQIHEESPLLSQDGDGDEEQEGLISDDRDQIFRDHAHDDYNETKGLWYMVLLTISIGGLQLAWSVELSNGTPFLLSLGLSKSLMALVWIAGPLSGALVQPYVGMLSDNCRSPWGKRTPFMVIGTVATIIALLALAWVREIVGGFLGLFGADRESQGVKVSIIVVAVLFVYVLDFAINTGMYWSVLGSPQLTFRSTGWN